MLCAINIGKSESGFECLCKCSSITGKRFARHDDKNVKLKYMYKSCLFFCTNFFRHLKV